MPARIRRKFDKFPHLAREAKHEQHLVLGECGEVSAKIQPSFRRAGGRAKHEESFMPDPV